MLIEAFTYRIGAHTTSDDPTRYRDRDEVELWKTRDPISRLRKLMDRQGWADDAFYAELDAEADRLAVDVRAACVSLPEPSPLSIFDHVYAEPHSLVDAERAELAGYLATLTSDEGH
jgi:pyruvate dehydrogenase E1 component alpha subunit